ncbi:MAG: transcription elongation factor Spt5 [Candidatus Methanomethylophilaceae archaeon]|nr:transcription elongation factor Spt5 [Candidatus Methanomethylophilaceae archaeon]
MDLDEAYEDDVLEDEPETVEKKEEASVSEPVIQTGGLFATEDDTMKKVSAGSMVEWAFTISVDSSPATLSFSVASGRDDAPEWEISLHDGSAELWNSTVPADSVEIGTAKALTLLVECPGGVRYGDSIVVTISARSGSRTDSIRFEAIAKQSIMILKTQIDQEKTVADELNAKALRGSGEKDIYAILSPQGLRGYVFVEGMNTERLLEKTREIKKARNFIPGETAIQDIEAYLTPTSPVIGIAEGDIVELVNGPFKGEKARVQKIEEVKEEITVELIEAMVPIPVTVKGDSVRLIEKEK